MSIEVIIMMVGMGLGGHFNKALEESGKETFTKEDLIPIHAKAVMELKDFKSLKARKSGYRMHIATTEDNTKETLFRTTRGFFLQKGSSPAIEISVTQAQAFYDAYGININTGW